MRYLIVIRDGDRKNIKHVTFENRKEAIEYHDSLGELDVVILQGNSSEEILRVFPEYQIAKLT